MRKSCVPFFIILLFVSPRSAAQVLTLPAAIDTAVNNYGIIRAKKAYVKSAEALAKGTSALYLPDIGIGAENVYGSANGIFGPMYPGKVPAVSSGGPVFLDQNWNSAFGALYLANVNWDFFTFGKVHSAIAVARANISQGAQDLEQEVFQHKVRVAAAYLNLLAAQRLRVSQQDNLDRAIALRAVVMARALNGLNPGVDSSLANAEVSAARTALNNAVSAENDLNSQLAQLMGVANQPFALDTLFLARIPQVLSDTSKLENHPLLKYYQTRIDLSKEQEHYYSRSIMPVMSLFGVMQYRGSGFGNQYSVLNPHDYSHDYWSGIKPSTGNYVLGMGISWNLISPFKLKQQVIAQQFTTRGLQGEMDAVTQKLQSQLVLADQNIKNALDNYREAPIQWKAASDAYLQKSTLYGNGLTNLVDMTQALYTLNRAQTNREISNANVWQALLYKAAASGDISLFLSQQ